MDASSHSNPISAISHKLRTPMTVIMSTVDNLLDGAFGSLNADQKMWLKKLSLHTANLELLLNQILDIMREHEKKSVEINAILDKQATSKEKPAGEKTESKLKSPKIKKHLKILAVDDEPDILDVMKEGLETQGLMVITASNGNEAVKMAKAEEPDLVLMDVHLTHENGLAVSRRIKEALPSFTPVIIVTGQDDLRATLSGSAFDADDLLTKPFQMVELFARVASMLKIKKLHDQLEEFNEKR